MEVTPTIERQLMRLEEAAAALEASAIRVDARLWQLQRGGADLHELREQLHAAAEAIHRLRQVVKAA